MFIHEAMSTAIANGRCIKRSGPAIWSQCKVWPKHIRGNEIYLLCSGGVPRRGWQPSGEDLIADDWVVTA